MGARNVIRLYECVRGYKIKSCDIFVLSGTVMLDEMY